MFLEGSLYSIDIAFPHIKLAIEIDGRRHQQDQDLFRVGPMVAECLVANGWRVLRFTWTMLKEHPEIVVATIVSAIALKN